MARDYLVVQVTSVPSEEIFSTAKHTISAVRNQLDSEKARVGWLESVQTPTNPLNLDYNPPENDDHFAFVSSFE